MGFDKVFADGKAETASLYFRAWNAEITVEDTLMVTRIDSFPKVLHEYFHLLVLLARTDNDMDDFMESLCLTLVEILSH